MVRELTGYKEGKEAEEKEDIEHFCSTVFSIILVLIIFGLIFKLVIYMHVCILLVYVSDSRSVRLTSRHPATLLFLY